MDTWKDKRKINYGTWKNETFGVWKTQENYDRWVRSKLDIRSTDEEQEEIRKRKNEIAKIYSQRLRERGGEAFLKYERERGRQYYEANKERKKQKARERYHRLKNSTSQEASPQETD
jgi:hypothetical protein